MNSGLAANVTNKGGEHMACPVLLRGTQLKLYEKDNEKDMYLHVRKSRKTKIRMIV